MGLGIIFLLTAYGKSIAQISPGELTTAHADLEGMSNCTKCHVIGEKPTDENCLECHTEIQSLINSSRGYHSNIEVKSKNCFRCHNEHHGRNFAIISFNEEGFDHGKSGYILDGKHQDLKCSECHKSAFIKDDHLKKKSKTFLGLDNGCITCHEDVHQKSLGDDCSKCHTTAGFKHPAGFDHNKTKFKLTGKHITTECTGCHKIVIKKDKQFQQFSGINFSTCEACHLDTHKGKFGPKCETCHITDSFHKIKNIDDFNHDKTNYPLQGKHEVVSCLSCHKGGLHFKPRYKQCIDCHADYHEGQLTKERPKDCKECHTVDGFTPSKYTIELHNKTGFKLLGSHLAIPCRFCHFNETKWNFKFASLRCIECHENVHGQSISTKYFGDNECANCHTENKWSVVSFEHNLTDFKLNGVHKTTPCRNCHYKETYRGTILHLFSALETRCENCHEDFHRGQFKSNNRTDCRNCHGFDNWKAINFDHNKTRFILDGAHKNVECSKCHKTLQDAKGQFIQYKFEDLKCENCHS